MEKIQRSRTTELHRNFLSIYLFQHESPFQSSGSLLQDVWGFQQKFTGAQAKKGNPNSKRTFEEGNIKSRYSFQQIRFLEKTPRKM